MPRPPSHDWETDPRPFGEVLRDWRDRHGWSDAEAARQLRVRYSTLRDWLPEGRRDCRVHEAMRRLMMMIDAPARK